MYHNCVAITLLTILTSVTALPTMPPNVRSYSSSTEIQTAGWTSNPPGRGTSAIMISCFLTLTLCVWNAMHLNIPRQNQTRRQSWLRNAGWVLLGILVPELVLLVAWRQWTSARRLSDALARLSVEQRDGSDSKSCEQTDVSPPEPRRYPWTITHSFYVGMGGLVFESPIESDSQQEGVHIRPQRFTITARGALLLAKCGRLPDIDLVDIKDKSKADGLAKALVLIQALWMLFQTAGRLFARVPISLLEVNTFGHILIAFVIYVLWWHKPREVYEPTILRGDWVNELAAYMYISSRISNTEPSRKLQLRSRIKPDLANLVYDEQDQLFYRSSNQERSTSAELAARSVKTYPAIRARFELSEYDSPLPDPNTRQLRPVIEQLVEQYATDWPSDHLLPGLGGEVMGMALWFTSIAYGGVHLAAWNEYFPSASERTMWRASSIYISFSGLLWFLLNVSAFLSRWANEWWDRFADGRQRWFEYAVLGVVATVCAVAYIMARLFLVVDAAASLRQMPVQAYTTPDWSVMIPHL